MDNGPSVVFSSIGSPGLRAASAAWNFSRNLSASVSTTMNRFAAQQVWPVLYIRPQTAHLMVWSRSASSSTMNASLPPSSIEEGLRFCPGPRRDAPAGRDAAGQRNALDARIVDDAVRLLVRDQQIGIQPGRRARVDPQLLEGDGALRHDAGVLHQQDVARHQMRTGDPRKLVIGKVPGLDAEDHADRAALHVGFAEGRMQLRRAPGSARRSWRNRRGFWS